MDCHFLLQGIFPTQGSNPGLPALEADTLTSEPPGKPSNSELKETKEQSVSRQEKYQQQQKNNLLAGKRGTSSKDNKSVIKISDSVSKVEISLKHFLELFCRIQTSSAPKQLESKWWLYWPLLTSMALINWNLDSVVLYPSSMLTSLFKSLQKYVCMLGLKPCPILLFGEILLWERSSVVFLLSASNNSFLSPNFGLGVSFGSVPTKRWTQFSGNRRNATVICRMSCVHAQSCPTLWDLINYSPPGSSVHGILHARILE